MGEGFTQEILVGKLLRWTHESEYLNTPYLVLQVGRCTGDGPNFVTIFSKPDLDAESDRVSTSDSLLAHRTSTSETEFCEAIWILDENNKICGLTVSAKSDTSSVATIEEVRFDPETFEHVSTTRLQSSAFSLKPAQQYVLPKPTRLFRDMPDSAVRPTRKDFKTQGDLQPYLHMSMTSDFVVNKDSANIAWDEYVCTLSLFNKTKDHVVVMSLNAQYRLVGNATYSDVLSIATNMTGPVPIEPLKNVAVIVTVRISRTEADKKRDIRCWNTDLVSRDSPLRLKIIASDMEDRTGSLVCEYVHWFPRPEKQRDGDIEFIMFDDYFQNTRMAVNVTFDNENKTLTVGNYSTTAKELDALVYKAIQEGVSEVQVYERSVHFVQTMYALVDVKCKVVYAIKLILTNVTHSIGLVHYVRVPYYGDNTETSPISYAKEIATLPQIQEQVVEEFVVDDKVDDIVPRAPTATFTPRLDPVEVTSVTSAVSAPANAMSQNLDKRLASIENTLGRMAVAMERSTVSNTSVLESLAEVLQTLVTQRSELPKIQPIIYTNPPPRVPEMNTHQKPVEHIKEPVQKTKRGFCG
jgi:hypothetical protein